VVERILRYVLRHDTGMAPCIDNNLLTLATCKPKVRASAKPGDWVVGFRPCPSPHGLVVWAGRVALSIGVGDYERQYRGRSDAVYREKPGGGYRRLRPDYHPDEKEFLRDISSPVLIFDTDTTWYFGKKPERLPDGLMHLAGSGRGHLVKDVKEGDATALQSWLSSIKPPAFMRFLMNPLKS